MRIHHSSNQYRILYFFYVRKRIVLVHAFAKKTQELKEREIETAERRMDDWIRRHANPLSAGFVCCVIWQGL